MKKTLFVQIVSILLCVVSLQAQTSFDQPTQVYLMHSSGNHLECDGSGRGVLKAPVVTGGQMMTFVPVGSGYYNIKASNGRGFLALEGDWNTIFTDDSASSKAKYAIEKVAGNLVRLKCRANGKYLGTDGVTAGQWVFTALIGKDQIGRAHV